MSLRWRSRAVRGFVGVMLCGLGCHGVAFEAEAPRIEAALAQGRLAEQELTGSRQARLALAVSFYCDAGRMGSSEGYYRAGRLLRDTAAGGGDPALANAYLLLAAQLGHREAEGLIDPELSPGDLPEDCATFSAARPEAVFDVWKLVSALPAHKQKIARLIRRHAPRYGVDERFALAIGLTESNLEPLAVSAQNAQGVMQLGPETQERFGVTRPFDPENNIHGALAYLRWLAQRFNHDWVLVAAAYNAGEGSVARFQGLPPFAETQQFVRRVLFLAGHPARHGF